MSRWRLCVALLAALACVGAGEVASGPTLVLDAGGHTGPVTHAFFRRRAGQLQVISASADNTVRIWDCATGETRRTLRVPVLYQVHRGRNAGVLAASLSPDGRLLAVGCHGRSPGEHGTYLFDLDEGRIVRYEKSTTGIVFGLVFAPDGRTLASCGDQVVRVWDALTGAERARLVGHEGDVHAIGFSPDGSRLASAGTDHTVRIWSCGNWKKRAVLELPVAGIGLSWAPDGSWLALYGADNRVHRRHVSGRDLGSVGPGTEAQVRVSLTFAGPTRLLVGPRVLDLERNDAVGRCIGAGDVFRCSALSPDGKLAVFAGEGGPDLLLWKVADGSVVHRLAGNGRTIHRVGWGPDGKALCWQWASAGPGHRYQRTAPLSFDLTGLKLSPLSDQRYRRDVRELGGVALERAGRGRVAIERGGEELCLIHPGRRPDSTEPVTNCFTFLGPGNVVLGGELGLELFDARAGKPSGIKYRGAGVVHSIAPSPDGSYFVSGGASQVLHVWKAERATPLLSLFVGGSDWIAWTEEGYYAASVGGERLMGWQVDNGPELLPTFHPAARFRPALCRPDVIRLLLSKEAGGSLARALGLADMQSASKTSVGGVGRVLPPRVVITAPAKSGQTVEEPQVCVRAKAQSTGEHAVASLQLLLDDRPYGPALAVGRPGTVEKQWDVDLTPGPHRLSVLARSEVSSAAAETIEVSYRPRVPVAPDQRPVLYVLAIGINEYEGDWKLDFARNDAEKLAESFCKHSKSLFHSVECRLVRDKEATRKGILEGLQWLKGRVRAQDVAVIFYAGHGYTDPAGHFYLLSVDMDEDRLEDTTVSADDLRNCLTELPGRALLLLDACHSAPADAVRLKRRRGAAADTLVRDLSDEGVGVIVLVAAQGPEESREDTDLKHGYFTQALLEGLSGKADYNKDGLVDLTELNLYVENQVVQWTKDLQHPAIGKPATIRSFPLTKP